MEFTLHTRGNIGPQDKPQILVVSAPSETDKQEELVTELLDHEYGLNAAVWTSEEIPSNENDLLLASYSRMNLVVIAVTSALMSSNFETFKKFADAMVSHAIPMIPIFYADEVIHDFNTKIGVMHGIKHYAKTYKEQLKDQLTTLVVADEITEKVLKGAFDGRLFLSYRKKDRTQALNIMKEIHTIPTCQALAIWFDDYLVAGRDFNDEIKSALLEAESVVLAVTPNLLEKGNYVETEEYPFAKNNNKPVVPVEADKTDEELLAERYQGIDKVVPCYDEEALRQSILDSIEGKGKDENQMDAMQLYLLGMAYYSGIRVEKDSEKAVKLLEMAANKELPEAALQLGFMYISGIGVKRDEKKCLEWKGKAYEICESAQRDDDRHLLRLAHKACFGEDGLVIGYYAIDELAQARQYCVRMHNLIQEYPASWTSETWRAEALIEYANPHYEGFREVEPKTIYKRLEIVEEGLTILNANSFPDMENLYIRAIGYSVKGHLIERLNTFMTSAKKDNVFEAMEAFKKSIELHEMVYKVKKTWVHRKDLGLAYSSMGILLSHSPGAGFTSEDAKGWYEKAIPLQETNYQEIHLPSTQENLAYAYANYGMELNDPEEMKMYRDKALALLKANYEETKDEHILQNIRDYEVSYDRLLNKNNKKGLFGWLKK